MVTLRTTNLTLINSTFCPHTLFLCFVRTSKQTATSTLNSINWLVFITVAESVYSAVRTDSIYKAITFSVSNVNPHEYPVQMKAINQFAVVTGCKLAKYVASKLCGISIGHRILSLRYWNTVCCNETTKGLLHTLLVYLLWGSIPQSV